MKKWKVICSILLCLMTSVVPLQAQISFDIVSEYAILINLKDNQILFEKNSEEKMYPASMTKVMTILTAMEYMDNLHTKVTITNEMLQGLFAEGASVAGFAANDQVTLEDLLYGALLPSGADACRAIAYYVSGSETAFVELMNQKATSLGLTNTHFMNTTGLHNDNHYTTVKEMAEIMKAAIQNKTIYEALTSDSYLTSNNIELSSTLRNQERNVSYISDITGGKTGFTLEGGLCLASFSSNDNTSYLLVTGNGGLDTSSYQHIRDAHAIYDTMYATYDYKEVLAPQSSVTSIQVKYNLFHRSIDVALADSVYATVNKSYDMSKIKVTFDGALEIEAPIEEGQFLGNIVMQYEDEVLKQVPYYAETTIGKNWLLYGVAMILNFLVSIRYILLAIVMLFIGWVGYRRYKIVQRRKIRRQQRRK